MNDEKKNDLYTALTGIVGEDNVRCGEPMKDHTTFRVGGAADYFVTPSDTDQIKELAQLVKERGIPSFFMGNGSNLLVSDKGFGGVVVQLGRGFNAVRVEEDADGKGAVITARAGAMLSAIAREAMEHSLKGMEFAAGIPGTLGGAVMMNAGAYGGEMKQIISSVRVLTPENEIAEYSCDEMEFGYRHSIAMDRELVILEASMRLEKGERQEIEALMEELRNRRREKQPLDLPSAGSTFKRPEGHFAGALIMNSGLAGVKVGGAMVSDKHCGFIVNYDNATASDIKTLMDLVRERVAENFGVELEAEVRMIGEF